MKHAFAFSNNDPLLRKHFENALGKSKTLTISEERIHFKIDGFQADFDWDWKTFNGWQILPEDKHYSRVYSTFRTSVESLSKKSLETKKNVMKNAQLRTEVTIGIETLKDLVMAPSESGPTLSRLRDESMRLDFLDQLGAALSALPIPKVLAIFYPASLLFNIAKINRSDFSNKLPNSPSSIAAKTLYWSCQNGSLLLENFDNSELENLESLTQTHILKVFLEHRNSFLKAMLDDEADVFESTEFHFLVRSYCCFLACFFISNNRYSMFSISTGNENIYKLLQNFELLCKDSFWLKPEQVGDKFIEVRSLCFSLINHIQKLDRSMTRAELNSSFLLEVSLEIESFFLAEPAFALLAMGIMEIKTPPIENKQAPALVCLNADALGVYFVNKMTGKFPFDGYLDTHEAQNSSAELS